MTAAPYVDVDETRGGRGREVWVTTTWIPAPPTTLVNGVVHSSSRETVRRVGLSGPTDPLRKRVYCEISFQEVLVWGTGSSPTRGSLYGENPVTTTPRSRTASRTGEPLVRDTRPTTGVVPAPLDESVVGVGDRSFVLSGRVSGATVIREGSTRGVLVKDCDSFPSFFLRSVFVELL